VSGKVGNVLDSGSLTSRYRRYAVCDSDLEVNAIVGDLGEIGMRSRTRRGGITRTNVEARVRDDLGSTVR
jgi:hypothetical protein